MSYAARVIRVLIASPSDVKDERDISVRAMQEWNDINSSDRQLVILPVRWETHSSPEFGERPQGILNRQFVDKCDIVVGVFWTRIGTPTGEAESGTIEEIERLAKMGKPVMLYFSQNKQDPDSIDLSQLQKLRDFKKRIQSNALIETYSTQIEFRDKLTKQLELQVRALIAKTGSGDNEAGEIPPYTDIQFSFADSESGLCLSDHQDLKMSYLEISDFDKIPDYELPDSGKEEVEASKSVLAFIRSTPTNKDYYRQLATYFFARNLFVPLRFFLKNVGGVGARDVYVDLDITSDKEALLLLDRSSIPTSQPSKESNQFLIGDIHKTNPNEFLSTISGSWRANFELRALQPQREISPRPEYALGALESCTALIGAKVYADTLSKPIEHKLTLTIDVKKISVTASEFLKSLDRKPIDPKRKKR
jgi:hypothetical protein